MIAGLPKFFISEDSAFGEPYPKAFFVSGDCESGAQA
jgi:hypothetical protein